jgi:cytochrome c-type biogenesis protein CcmH/NrfG
VSSWRMLGQLHQENDEDEKAIVCLEKAYSLDPFDLESLLYLGSSCSNVYDKKQAMVYLANWLRFNPQYSDIVHLPEDMEQMNEFEMRDLMKAQVIFCLDKNQNDPNLLVVAGILAF